MGIKVSYQPPAPVAALGSWLGGFGQFAKDERHRAQQVAMEKAKMAMQQQQHQDDLALKAASMQQNAANQAADNMMRQQQVAMQGQQVAFNQQKDVANFWQDQQKMEMAPMMQEQAAKYQFDRQEAMQKAYQDRAQAQQDAIMKRQEDQQLEVAIRQAEEEAYKRVAAIKQFELDDPTGQKRDELLSKFDPGAGGGIIGARSAVGGDPQLGRSYLDNVNKWNREVDMATPAIRAGLKNKPQVIQPQFIDGPDGQKFETGNLIGYDNNGRPFSLGKYKTGRELEAERKATEQKNFMDFYAKTEKQINEARFNAGTPLDPLEGDELDAEIHKRWSRMQASVQRLGGNNPQQPPPSPMGVGMDAATGGMGMPSAMQGMPQMPPQDPRAFLRFGPDGKPIRPPEPWRDPRMSSPNGQGGMPAVEQPWQSPQMPRPTGGLTREQLDAIPPLEGFPQDNQGPVRDTFGTYQNIPDFVPVSQEEAANRPGVVGTSRGVPVIDDPRVIETLRPGSRYVRGDTGKEAVVPRRDEVIQDPTESINADIASKVSPAVFEMHNKFNGGKPDFSVFQPVEKSIETKTGVMGHLPPLSRLNPGKQPIPVASSVEAGSKLPAGTEYYVMEGTKLIPHVSQGE